MASAVVAVAGACTGAVVLAAVSDTDPAVRVVSVASSLVIPLIAAWSVLGRQPRHVTPADSVTLLRVSLIGILTAALVLTFANGMPARTWTVLVIAALAASLDAVDGWVARRAGSAGSAGARLDEESDAAALLVLSALLAMTVGWWVVLIGLMRYLFLIGQLIRNRWQQPLPRSRFRRFVAAGQAATVVIGLAPVVPVPLAATLTATALAVLLVSFGRDVLLLEGAGSSDGPEGHAGTGLP